MLATLSPTQENATSSSSGKSDPPQTHPRKEIPQNTRQWQRFILRVLGFLQRKFQEMPRAKALRWGERLGNFTYQMARTFFRRPIRYAHRNLRLTGFPHPNATEQEREPFIRRVFVNFAVSMTDFLRTPSREELESLLQVEGADHVYDALKTGKGVVFLTAHLGNFEFLPRYIAHTFCPLTVVARAPEDPEFADFVHHLRESGGYRVIYRGSRTLREMLTLLKRNEGVGLLPDQNSGDLFVPFLGVPAGTVAGPASLALHTGATLIPCYCVRQLDNTYRLLFLSPIAPTPTGDKQADTVRIMTAVNFALEEIVREYPDQWLWLHNRWKSAFEETNQERAFPHGIPDELQQRWHL